MKEITEAIKVKQAQVKKLTGDIIALQRAASALAGKKSNTAKTTRQPRTKRKAKRKQPTMSAAARKAVSERMKGYWAKRKRARR